MDFRCVSKRPDTSQISEDSPCCWWNFILVPRAHDPSGLWLGSRALAGPDFLSMRRVFVSHYQPIGFARFEGKSVNCGLLVFDQTRALDPNHWGTRMHHFVGTGATLSALYGTGSKLGDSSLSRLLFSRMRCPLHYHCIVLTLAVCVLFLSKFPRHVSFAKKLLPVSLGDFITWNGHSWKFISEPSSQYRHCVRFGSSVLEEEIL